MDMGSPLLENNSISHNSNSEMGRHTSLKKNYIHRPRFYPCEKCKKKFTIRALVVHKKTCTSSGNCCCSDCVKQDPLASDNAILSVNSVFPTNENNIITSDNHSLSSDNPDGSPKLELQNGSCVQVVSSPSTVNNNSTNLKLHSTTSNNDHFPSQFFVFDKDSEHSSSSPSSGLLLLHSAARILAISGMKLESSTESNNCLSKNSKSSIIPNGPIISGNTTGCPERQLLCCICNEFISWEVYGSHIIQHTELRLPGAGEINCPKCMKQFTRAAMFLIHFNKHLTDTSFVCRHCSMPFKLSDELKSHTLNLHGCMETQPYHCYICMRRFSHPQTIINHMRLHSKETPFKCSECSRSFSQIGNLQRHLSVHRGDRPHKCSACEKSFADPATLRNHVRIHTGETPFVCKVCSRGFTQIGNLKRHMARHLQNKAKMFPSNNLPPETSMFPTDDVENCMQDVLHKNDTSCIENSVKNETAYNATECLKSSSPTLLSSICHENSSSQPSSNSDSLDSSDIALSEESAVALSQLKEQRKRNKWQLFPCPVCGKVYTWQHDLTIHFRIHTGEKPYKCDMCEKRFAQSGAVRIHKSRHHITGLFHKG